MVAFVPGALPGQMVRVRVLRHRGNYLETKMLEVLKKSKDEIIPRCTHAHDAVGIVWQCLPYDKQLTYKEEIVRETLQHLTPVDAAVRETLPGRVLKIIPSPQVFHYRNKLELSFGYESMSVEERGGRRIYHDENPTIGFHPPGEWARVVPVTDCQLYDENLPTLLTDVRRFLEATRIPVYNPKTHRGLLRLLLLRRGYHTGENMIAFLVNARKKELEPLFQHFMRFGGRPGLASLLVIEHQGLSDKPEHPKIHCLVGKPMITEHLFDLTFEISPFSFFQTNTPGAEKLYRAIAEGAELTQRDTVLDAYCGMGTIGQYLARFCQRVVGIESSASAIDDALRSAGKNRIGNISFYKGRVEQILQEQLRAGSKYHFSVVILDPPRAGLHPKARDAVLAHDPERIVYVSCNIVTLARDLGAFLTHGYELRTVQPVDMFPHTSHIEAVAVLRKKG
jgi:23S rRNA (uracil1939-C5)-methyltransferase